MCLQKRRGDLISLLFLPNFTGNKWALKWRPYWIFELFWFEILAKIKIFVSQRQFCPFVDTLPSKIPTKLQDFCRGGSLGKVHIEAVFGHRNFKYPARNNMSDAVLCIFSGSNNKIFQNDLT